MNHAGFEVHMHKDKRLPFYLHKNIGRSRPGPTLSTWHPAVEILFCTDGKGQVACNMISSNFSEGDIFIINSNHLHCITTDRYLRYDCLIIDESFFEENGIDLNNVLFKSLIHDSTVSALFQDVADSFFLSGPYKTAQIRSLALRFILYLCQNYAVSGAFRTDSNTAGVELSKMAIGYINSHFTEKLTLDILAKETGVNKYHLCHEFKRITSHTVFSYINLRRCEKAASVLASGEATVYDACYSSGFDSPAYFTKTFKKYYGLSPFAYKKKSSLGKM